MFYRVVLWHVSVPASDILLLTIGAIVLHYMIDSIFPLHTSPFFPLPRFFTRSCGDFIRCTWWCRLLLDIDSFVFGLHTVGRWSVQTWKHYVWNSFLGNNCGVICCREDTIGTKGPWNNLLYAFVDFLVSADLDNGRQSTQTCCEHKKRRFSIWTSCCCL